MHKSKRVGHAVRYIKREKQTDERMHRGARIGVSLRSVSTCVLQIEREREKKEGKRIPIYWFRKRRRKTISKRKDSSISYHRRRRRGIDTEFERIDRLLRAAQEAQSQQLYVCVFFLSFFVSTRLCLSHSCSTRLFRVVCSCRPMTAARHSRRRYPSKCPVFFG